MFTSRGIGMDSLVTVDGDCPVSHEVVGDEVQFRFGAGRSTGLTLVCTAGVVERLMAEAGAAMQVLGAEQESER